ncbi:MAG: hypothetical protein ACLUI3_09975 [Christensenellales bacterium]
MSNMIPVSEVLQLNPRRLLWYESQAGYPPSFCCGPCDIQGSLRRGRTDRAVKSPAGGRLDGILNSGERGRTAMDAGGTLGRRAGRHCWHAACRSAGWRRSWTVERRDKGRPDAAVGADFIEAQMCDVGSFRRRWCWSLAGTGCEYGENACRCVW